MTSLIPWKRNEGNGDPLRVLPISQMRWDWDRLFDRFLDDAWRPASLAQGMPLDVAENDEQVRVRVEVPGFGPDDLEISLAGEVLTINGKKVDEDETGAGGFHYSERQFGSCQRSVKLPCPVDPDHVKAEHKNGVLTITLQKAENVRPKRIKVKSA